MTYVTIDRFEGAQAVLEDDEERTFAVPRERLPAGAKPGDVLEIECMIPTVGVYPIATANEKDQISAPLMSRFAVIEIPDYTPEETEKRRAYARRLEEMLRHPPA